MTRTCEDAADQGSLFALPSPGAPDLAGYAVLAIELHGSERPGSFVHAVISDACPASVIIANLTAGQ